MRRLALMALIALAGCVKSHPERQIIADCTPNAWLWKDNAGRIFVATNPDFALPVAAGADIKQICSRLKDAPK